MTSRTIFLIVFALLAASTAVVFIAISVDSDLYAPGSSKIRPHLGIEHAISKNVSPRFAAELSPRLVLRKIYSVIAFAVVGFFSAPLLGRRHRVAWCALLIAGFSGTIEIVQRSTVSQEGNLSSLFDIGCGALGGVIGALIFEAARGLYRRKSPTQT